MRSALDRGLQRQALEELAGVFPERVDGEGMFPNEPRENVAAVLAYLQQHGLVDVEWARPISEPDIPATAAITAKGLDFLADDGGLGAILGVVTVKLHDETLRELLSQAVEKSGGDASMKAHLIDQIKRLPAEGLKEATMAAAKMGLAATPGALAAIQSQIRVWLG